MFKRIYGEWLLMFIGFLFIGAMLSTVLILLMSLRCYFMGFPFIEKLTPYSITSFFILLLSIMTAKLGQNPFDNAYRGIIKVFSSYGIPYWIVVIYHLYIYVYLGIFLLFGNFVEQNIQVMGLEFNYIVANSLMILSFLSITTLYGRVINKFID